MCNNCFGGNSCTWILILVLILVCCGGCGFGGCMGCSCQTKNGAKRICKEGPVLKKEEIIW